jgi:hypothetical protein
MQEKRNHHILPQLYLRGFADLKNTSFIWAYTKGRKFAPGGVQARHNPARIPIAKAAMVPYAYGYTRTDGSFDPDTFENELERLEKPADSVFRKLRDRVMLDAAEKEIFASYVLLMHRRVPKEEQKVREDWEALLKESPEFALLRSPQFLERFTDERRTEIEEVLARYEKGPQKEVLLKAMVSGWNEVLPYLRAMRWRFLVAGGSSKFFTGDHPVFTSSLGLIKLPAELTFPVSKDITLHASWQPGPESFVVVSEAYTRQLNHRTASNSKELFHSRCERWVASVLNKDDHPIYLLDVSGALPLLWQHRTLDVPREWLA